MLPVNSCRSVLIDVSGRQIIIGNSHVTIPVADCHDAISALITPRFALLPHWNRQEIVQMSQQMKRQATRYCPT